MIDTSIPHPNIQPLTSDENQAMLAWNTNLMEQLIPQDELEQSPEQPQEQEIAPQQEEMPQPQETPITDLEGFKSEIMSELEGIKKLIQKDDKTEISDLKKRIEEELNKKDEQD